MSQELDIETYALSILSIRDKLTNEVFTSDKYKIDMISSKYSNTKLPIPKLILNNKPISRNNNLLVTFKCQSCNIGREITLNLFIRRIQHQSKTCSLCCNKEETKCSKHSEFIKNNFDKIRSDDYISTREIKLKSLPIDEKINISNTEWNNEDDEFKKLYFLQNLNEDEFDKIKNKILGINNKKITDLTEWTYFPYFRIYNQTKYTPMLINLSKTLIEKPSYITFKCELCDNEFTHRDLYIVKNKIKIYCKDCSLTNRTFRIRKFKLKNGNSIVWQSLPEKRFIEWCETNNISIQNGPKIKYNFEEKEHIYKVDFELPDKKIYVEIKDNHCWYKEQVKNGKQPAKELALKEYSEKNLYTYLIIFPKTLSTAKKHILKTL